MASPRTASEAARSATGMVKACSVLSASVLPGSSRVPGSHGATASARGESGCPPSTWSCPWALSSQPKCSPPTMTGFPRLTVLAT